MAIRIISAFISTFVFRAVFSETIIFEPCHVYPVEMLKTSRRQNVSIYIYISLAPTKWGFRFVSVGRGAILGEIFPKVFSRDKSFQNDPIIIVTCHWLVLPKYVGVDRERIINCFVRVVWDCAD